MQPSSLAVIVVNYQQTAATLACLDSLYRHAGTPFELVLVDNAATQDSSRQLGTWLETRHAEGRPASYRPNADNLGFAVACNQALEPLLARPEITAVALINNDTLVEPNWLSQLTRGLDPAQRIAMVASAMVDLADPTRVDNLGITLYASGIASNRRRPQSPLLGPCGGGALYSAELLRQVRALDNSGQVFDPAYFCYAEDTDVALRARALGYRCGFAPGARLRHHGSLASGGAGNRFVAYYGLRNSLFNLIKNLPGHFIRRNLHWIILMQAAVFLKYLIKGQPLLLWRIYRDLYRALPRLRRQRRHIQTGARWQPEDWRRWTQRSLYDLDYIRTGLRTLHHRDL